MSNYIPKLNLHAVTKPCHKPNTGLSKVFSKFASKREKFSNAKKIVFIWSYQIFRH